MSIAFFDFDRTLIAANSGTLWVRAELAGGHMRWTEALRAMFWIARYQLGQVDVERAIRKTIEGIAGTAEVEIRDRASRFYEREIRTLYRPGARTAVESHRTRGDRLVLLTSSTVYMSEPVVRDLGLDGHLSNSFEVGADGRYTGRPIEPLCYGAGKVVRAREYAASAGVPLEACTFYSDSTSDLPVFEAVGQPVVVNPDPRLRRIALRRGWPVADWGAP